MPSGALIRCHKFWAPQKIWGSQCDIRAPFELTQWRIGYWVPLVSIVAIVGKLLHHSKCSLAQIYRVSIEEEDAYGDNFVPVEVSVVQQQTGKVDCPWHICHSIATMLQVEMI